MNTRTIRLAAVVGAFALLGAACGDGDTGTPAPEAPVPEADNSTTTTADDAAGPGTTTSTRPADTGAASLLIDCTTTVVDDVPAFYATYFRCVDISMDGDLVVITSVNEPPHMSGYYPEDDPRWEPFDTTGGRHQNPNRIAGETITLRIPVDPQPRGIVIDTQTVNATVGDGTDYPMGPAGIALDGVALFNPLAAPGDNIEQEVWTFDDLSGHPQQQGGYHYHGTSEGPLTVLLDLGLVSSAVVGEAETELYGVMCDGTVVLGATELDGSEVSGDLDLQNGHTHDLVASDGTVMLVDRYHVHMGTELSLDPRGLTPEAQWYDTCAVG